MDQRISLLAFIFAFLVYALFRCYHYHGAIGETFRGNGGRDTNSNKPGIIIEHDMPSERSIEGLLFQGDIKLSNRTSHRNLATIPFYDLIWDNDVRNGYHWITVRISNSFSDHTKDLIKSSLLNLQWRSQVIRFEFIYERPGNGIPYIHYLNGDEGCWSYIGRNPDESIQPWGQIIMFQEDKCATMVTVQHEMMHALGFGHEQTRPDRDEYVEILWQNVRQDRIDQFQTISEVDSLGTPYDYDSIMHYPEHAWSDNDLPTMKALNGSVIGNRMNASWTDILQIRLMYQCLSGPRYLIDYETQKCSTDCKCWHNEPGCGNDDSFCNDDLICQDNVCILRADKHSGSKLIRSDMEEIHGQNYFYVPGAMFDIQAKANPIKLTNIYYQGIKGDVWVDIYSKEWTHFKWAENEEKWDLIGSAYLKVTADDSPTLFPTNSFQPILVDKWNRRGFYIQTKDCGTDCNKLRVWLGEHYAETTHPFMENDSARILEGCALKGKFDNIAKKCKDERGGESFTFWGGAKYVIRDE